MRNILIEIEYDGTNYYGWQLQPKGRTIQGEIVSVLKELTGTDITVHGAGRTDSRVHARGQTASFTLVSSIPTDRIPQAMNRLLPADISVKKAHEVPGDFHARYSAIGKRYSYQIYRGPNRSALLRNYCHHVIYSLDLEKMKEGAALLIGTHDFGGFMSSGSSVKSTVRTVHAINLKEEENRLWLTFEGNGFLYNMVRIMVGTLIQVSAGQRSLENIKLALENQNRNEAGPTAPPQGLFLDKVFYQDWNQPITEK